MKDYGVWRLVKKAIKKPGLIKTFLFQPLYSTYAREEDIPVEQGVEYVMALTGAAREEVIALWGEVKSDTLLQRGIVQKLSMTKTRPSVLRGGWRELVYVITRIMRPEVMVEAGTYDGLAAAYILAAMKRNEKGILHGIDINLRNIMPVDIPDVNAGWIIPDYLRDRWVFHSGASVAVLPDILSQNSVTIVLSDTTRHSLEEELALYRAFLKPGALVFRSSPQAVDVSTVFPQLARYAVLSKGGSAGCLTGFAI